MTDIGIALGERTGLARLPLLGAVLRSRAATLGFAVLLAWGLVAALAPWLAPYDPTAIDFAAAADPSPSPEHLLGTDSVGRDLLSRMRKTLIDQILRPHGVTRSQWWILANLARNRSRSLSQVELGRLLDMGKASVGTLIQALEKSGLVARVPAPDDARAKHVMLTNEGLKKLQGMTDITQPTNDRIVDGISQKDMDVAIRVLSTMKHNLKTIFEESEEI